MQSRPNILLVDDKAANLFALERVLCRLDVELFKAKSGEQALEMTLDHEFALILMDVQMPGMDGYEVARLLHSQPETRCIPIIFITAIDRDRQFELKGYETGAVDFIFKPVNEVILLGKVRVFVDLHRSRLELVRANREMEAAMERANLMAEEAVKGERAKTEFLANMSHEIRTPMNAIIGFADILAEEAQLIGDEGHYLQLIRSSARNLLQIIDDILDLSKIESGKFDMQMDTCRLKAFVDEIAALMTPMALDKGLAFDLTWRGEVPSLVRTDPIRLRQCLVNLLGNAVKFTDDGSVKLAISAVEDQEKEPYIRFDVEDTGIGIPDKCKGTILDPFTQADSGRSRRHGGTGLGLAITRQLARLMGGELTFTSTVGIGSVFSLTIPAEAPSQQVIEQVGPVEERVTAVTPIETSEQAKRHILVAEDTLTNQLLVRRLLEKAGFEVSLADDGQIAFDMVTAPDSPGFDLIFMDMQMPNMNGYEATEALRGAGVTIPIVALTAHAMDADRRICMEAGCDDYLSKPIDRQALVEILQRYLAFQPETADSA